MGRTAGVSAGHPLTTAAAVEILQQGGNAFDAGVAAMLVGGVVEQDLYGFGGEGLVLVYPAQGRPGHVGRRTGLGARRPRRSTGSRSRNKTLAGEGLDPVVVPGAPHAALTVLERWGTMTFAQVAARAIALRARRISAAAADGGDDRAAARVHRPLADEPEDLAQARRQSLYKRRRHDRAAGARRRRCRRWWPRRRARLVARARGRAPRRPRSVLQGRHRAGNGEVPARARSRRSTRVTSPNSSRASRRRRRSLPRPHRLQARLQQPGPVAAADAEHPRDTSI